MPSTHAFRFEVLVNNVPLTEYFHTLTSNGSKSYISCPSTPRTRYTVRVYSSPNTSTFAARLKIDGVPQGGYVLSGYSDATWEGRPINAEELQPFYFAPAQWDFERPEDMEKAKMIGTISIEFSEIEVLGEQEHPLYEEGEQAVVKEGSGKVATHTTGYGEKEKAPDRRPFVDVRNLRDTPHAILVVEYADEATLRAQGLLKVLPSPPPSAFNPPNLLVPSTRVLRKRKPHQTVSEQPAKKRVSSQPTAPLKRVKENKSTLVAPRRLIRHIEGGWCRELI